MRRDGGEKKAAADDDSSSDDDAAGEARLRRVYESILDKLCAAQEAVEAARGRGAQSRNGSEHEAPHEHTERAEHAGQRDGDSSAASAYTPPSTVLGALGDVGAASKSEVRAQVAGLLFAGLNSAKELKALITLVARHPTVQDDARAEVDSHLGTAPPSYEDLSGTGKGGDAAHERPSLAFCACVVQEALRLSPGIEHLRLVTTRSTLVTAASTPTSAAMSMTLPRGTRLVVSPSLMHKHPRHWPSPRDAFRPELFAPAAQQARPAGCFLPFSAGPKACPAAAFALHEMRMLLAMVLQRFELREATGGGVYVTSRRNKEQGREEASTTG